MSWHSVCLADVPASPWRNGGGVTRELACWPEANDWRWRVSVAEVESSGPFSRFDGVQRWFAVLSGAGVRLNLHGQAHELTRASEPFAFDGAAAVDCELLAGATQDFNLMVRGAGACAKLQRIRGTQRFAVRAGTTVAVYAVAAMTHVTLDGQTLALPAHSLCWKSLATAAPMQVDASEALYMGITA